MALQYPPHVVALACIYLAALLSTFEQNEAHAPLGHHNNHDIVATLRDHGPWEEKFQAQVDDLEGERTFTILIVCTCSRAGLFATQSSYLACASRSAYIADTEPLRQHNPKHAIVPITPHFAHRTTYSSTSAAYFGPAHAAQNSHARD